MGCRFVGGRGMKGRQCPPEGNLRMMRRFSLGLCSLLMAAFAGAGCGDEEPPIDRVGVNVVEKSIFTGSWYMSRTVIDVDYEGAALGTYPGDVGSDYAQDFTAMPRIRWVIDENYLFAYRDYELTLGGDGDKNEAISARV